MLDAADGEAAGRRSSRWGWRSFLMSRGGRSASRSFVPIKTNWHVLSRSPSKAIKKQEMRAEDEHCRMTDESQSHVIVAKERFSTIYYVNQTLTCL